jgi:hypothetical protein
MKSRQRRMKYHGRFGIKRHINLAHHLVAVEIAVHATERHVFLLVSELDSDQLLGVAHHLFRDAHRRG